MMQTDLDRLELLQAFKVRMPHADLAANLGPFDGRVSTAASGLPAGDLPGVHAGAREHVRQTIADVRDSRTHSQVILLSGAAGVGKTHLLRSFKTPEAVADTGHIFVGGSNTWSVREFQAQLLDWVVSALTEVTPAEEHPLLHRVRAIGYRAIEHMLSNPVTWKTCLTRHRGGFFGRLRDRLARPSADEIKKLVSARDPRVFDHFDFAAFSGYVCDKFLADRSNLAHRFALRVLLIYLFPDKTETGIGSRERVLHWFRGRGDDAYFLKRLGATEKPDRAYTQFEAVKLLAHLFSPAVSKELATETFGCPPRVFLLTFDQVEGRDELFSSDADWKDFFANLSELYNTLPNVVVLFTMTMGLRDRLRDLMERQFRDRIRMDPKFTLKAPSDEQILSLYRSRIELWLNDDDDLRERYAKLSDSYLPLDRETVLRLAGGSSIRSGFERLDAAFREHVSAIAVDAPIDYLFDRNERKKDELAGTQWDYTANHVSTVKALLNAAGPVLEAEYKLQLREMEESEVTGPGIGTVPVLRLLFAPTGSGQTVTVYLARLGGFYTSHIAALIDHQLRNREKARNFLWVVRAQPMPDAMELVQGNYLGQFYSGSCPIEVQSAFASLTAVCGKRDDYIASGQVAALDDLIRLEVGKTYLGKLLTAAQARLEALAVPAPEPVNA